MNFFLNSKLYYKYVYIMFYALFLTVPGKLQAYAKGKFQSDTLP